MSVVQKVAAFKHVSVLENADDCFSLGLSTKSEERRRVEGVRDEAIHIRGIDNMNTHDVFHYFRQFNPDSIEWIDNSTCM